MDVFTIYHNPRCSKSRKALAILQKYSSGRDGDDYLQKNIASELLTHIQLLEERCDLLRRIREAGDAVKEAEKMYPDVRKGVFSNGIFSNRTSSLLDKLLDDEQLENSKQEKIHVIRIIDCCGQESFLCRNPIVYTHST